MDNILLKLICQERNQKIITTLRILIRVWLLRVAMDRRFLQSKIFRVAKIYLKKWKVTDH